MSLLTIIKSNILNVLEISKQYLVNKNTNGCKKCGIKQKYRAYICLTCQMMLRTPNRKKQLRLLNKIEANIKNGTFSLNDCQKCGAKIYLDPNSNQTEAGFWCRNCIQKSIKKKI